VTPAELRWCANGKHCASAPALGGPARLSRSNTDRYCFACGERRIDEQLVPPSFAGQSYTVTEAADLLGVPRWRVEYLVTAGQLRARRDGRDGRLWIAESDLEHFEEAS
jgi:excisionase family DNA binding protein